MRIGTAIEPVEDEAHVFLQMPMPLSLTVEHCPLPVNPRAISDLAVRRVFKGVVDDVGEGRLEALQVGETIREAGMRRRRVVSFCLAT